jgi:predicted transcriptional regulator
VEVIALIHDAVSKLGDPGIPISLQTSDPGHRHVTPDYIICLETGRRLKTMRRYLMATHGLTPEAYRSKWGLPADYPMVAPNYSKARRAIAVAHGLGRPQPR